MANRRMIGRAITETNEYLKLCIEAKALYPLLVVNADDDGFTSNVHFLCRAHAIDIISIEQLEEEGFIYRFESGAIVIRHWRQFNTLQNDRYHPTNYQDEMRSLVVVGGKDNWNSTGGTYLWKHGASNSESEYN